MSEKKDKGSNQILLCEGNYVECGERCPECCRFFEGCLGDGKYEFNEEGEWVLMESPNPCGFKILEQDENEVYRIFRLWMDAVKHSGEGEYPDYVKIDGKLYELKSVESDSLGESAHIRSGDDVTHL